MSRKTTGRQTQWVNGTFLGHLPTQDNPKT